jgi:hypothetical protein
MHLALRPYATAGIALTGAGLIAIAPITQPPPAENLSRAVALTAGSSDNAFTVDGLTFDPGADGYQGVGAFTQTPPLLGLGFGGLTINTGNPPPAGSSLEVYDSSGADIGAVHISTNAADIAGINSAQFTVQSIAPPAADIDTALSDSDLDFSGADFDAQDLADAVAARNFLDFRGEITASDVNVALTGSDINLNAAGIDPADVAGVLNGIDLSDELPANQTVYSITDFGSGFANVYTAVPNADGTAAESIHDTLVTPLGNIDIPTTFDAIAFMSPGDAFAPLGADGDFTIDGMTFDPGADGWDSIQPLIGVAPLLAIGGGYLETNPGTFSHLAHQDFAVSDGDGDDLGNIDTGVNSLNLLGIQGTELTVLDATPGDGADAADLPAEGTVYSVTNLGGGFYNVYESVPNADGDAADSIHDTFVTPFGNVDIPTDFDAIAALNPSGALDGLAALDAGDIGSDHAVTIGDTTLDPGSAGFDSLYPVFGIAPLLQLGGGHLTGIYDLATQPLTVYDGDGTNLGAANTGVEVANILGIQNAMFTIDGVHFGDAQYEDAIDASGVDLGTIDPNDLVDAFADSPAMQTAIANGDVTASTVFVAAIQSGINLTAAGVDTDAIADAINSAVADAAADLPDDGTVYDVLNLGGGFANVYTPVPGDDGATSITDTFITPWGDWNILTDFDATTPLDPGDAVAGVSDAAGGFDVFDPSTWF